MNSERVKQMEMENILSQGDLQALIENCNKQIRKCDQDWKDQLGEVGSTKNRCAIFFLLLFQITMHRPRANLEFN